jgi:predicted alpha/beta superfamily hydrolase
MPSEEQDIIAAITPLWSIEKKYMNKILTAIFALVICQLGNAQITERSKFSIGETLEIKSKILNESRTINIYLPDSYNKDSLRKYPVIYLLDGSKDEDFIHIAGLVQFCSFSWINIISKSIVVGIGNVDRKRDFTFPSSVEIDNKEFPTSGKSENFMDFIENELQLIIGKNYRVNNQKTIIGQSLGGLFATEVLFKRPEMFDNYIIISPSLWWDNELLLSFELKESLNNKKIYVGVGKEGEVMERLAKSLFEKLKIMKNGDSTYFGYFEKQNHGDALHLAVYDAFVKLFKKEEEKN